MKNIIKATIRMAQDYFGLQHVSVEYRYDLDLRGTDVNAVVDRYEKDWYMIELHPDFAREATEEELVKVVSHEMVHVNQFVNDALNLEYDLFRGKKYKKESYWFKPWEIEARGYEMAFVGLYNENWEKYSD